MLSSMLGLGGASWVIRVWVTVRVRVSYLNRNFVVVLFNSFFGAIYCNAYRAALHAGLLPALYALRAGWPCTQSLPNMTGWTTRHS